MQIWYWTIAGVALLWNLLGCAFLSMEVFAQEAVTKSMTEDQKAASLSRCSGQSCTASLKIGPSSASALTRA